MNVYVVSSCWKDSGATVIGAATDRAGAEQIADRYQDADNPDTRWAPWVEDVDPAEGSCTWRRSGIWRDNIVHPSLFQEIVVVPLAGYAERLVMDAGRAPWANPNHDVLADIQEIGRLFGAP